MEWFLVIRKCLFSHYVNWVVLMFGNSGMAFNVGSMKHVFGFRNDVCLGKHTKLLFGFKTQNMLFSLNSIVLDSELFRG